MDCEQHWLPGATAGLGSRRAASWHDPGFGVLTARDPARPGRSVQ